MGLKGGGGLGALDRQQRTILQALDLNLARELFAHDGEVVVLASAIDHHEQAVIIRSSGHQVVDDAALAVEQHGILLPAGLQADEVAGHDLLEGRQRRDAAQPGLAHVADVEQAGVLAGPEVLLHHAIGVLNRQLIAGERHHPPAQRHVGGVQRRGLEGLLGHTCGQDERLRLTTAQSGRVEP